MNGKPIGLRGSGVAGLGDNSDGSFEPARPAHFQCANFDVCPMPGLKELLGSRLL